MNYYLILMDIKSNKIVDVRYLQQSSAEEVVFKVNPFWVVRVRASGFDEARQRTHSLVNLVYLDNFTENYI